MDKEQKYSKYDDFISSTIDQYHVPGVSIAVVDGDSTWVKAYGIARYPDQKMTPDSVLNCASMTKAFTATGVSFLVDDDSLPDVQWSTPVSKLLRDDFVLSNAQSTEMVTLEDILSHRSGVPEQDDACLGQSATTPDTPKSITRKLRYLPMTAAPRTKFQYCNMMFVVALHVVETLTGTPMGDFLRSRIWDPLEMKDTYFGFDDAVEHKAIDKLAKGYGWDEKAFTHFEIPWLVQPEGAGAGEMHSTARDYAKFLRCMIRRTGPISDAAHEELVKPRTITDYPKKQFWSSGLYALGWVVETYHGETVISHGGSVDTCESLMLYLPRLEWGIVIFGNMSAASKANDKICWTLVDDLLDVPREKRFDWDADAARKIEERADETVESLYPDIPDPPIPLSLPLSNYAGSYKDDGFGTMVVQAKEGKLEIDATDRTCPIMLSFEHVSGEFFTANIISVQARDEELVRAEFRLDAAGTVDELGLAIVPDMDGEMIWFKRVVSTGD